ncbi:MAG: hypothetical protein HY830_01570 [Actinobacteria bacterium]|nr:hypothetical protein [Actinomycetota bacterium]
MSAPRTVIGLVVAAGLLVGGGVAAGTLAATGALASSASPSTSPSAGATRSPGVPGPRGDGDRQGHHRRDLAGGGPGGLGALGAGRMLHGEVVVETAGGGTQTLLVQRGTVTAKTADGVTVRSSDGFTTTWKVTAATQVRVGRPGPGRADGALSDVAQGAAVLVAGPRPTSGDPTAQTLGVRPAGQRDVPVPTGGTATPSPAGTTSGASLQG